MADLQMFREDRYRQPCGGLDSFSFSFGGGAGFDSCFGGGAGLASCAGCTSYISSFAFTGGANFTAGCWSSFCCGDGACCSKALPCVGISAFVPTAGGGGRVLPRGGACAFLFAPAGG